VTPITAARVASVYTFERIQGAVMDTVHTYHVRAKSTGLRSGEVASSSVPGSIEFSAPPEFLGQSGLWTPEDFFVASVVSCFVSTFSSMADLSKLTFVSLDVEAEGRLERVDGAWRFVQVALRPSLQIVHERDRERAVRLLEKAEKGCLIARSITARTILEYTVVVASEDLVATPAS
jgi:organic hydroperoxide reductase OsmC/OhrA